MTFRRFQTEDGPAVRALHELALRQAGAFLESAKARAWDRDLDDIEAIYLRPGGEFIVGIAKHRIVAMGGLLLLGERAAKIRRMRVHPNHQRRGYGRQLLERLERRARDRGLELLVLDATTAQEAALALYHASGFVEIRRDREEGFEMVFMEKRLI